MKKYIILLLVIFTTGASLSQTTLKSGYYLPGMLNRHKINPAVINEGAEGYVGIPIISNLTVSASTNMGLGKLLFPMANGELTTFMNSSVSASEFLKGLNKRNNLDVDFSTDILSGGFRAGKSYNTISLGLRSYTSSYIPYEMFDFMKSGMTSPQTSYTIKDLTMQTTNFLDLSYGYARNIGHGISVGGKIKFLFGLGNVNAQIDRMDINMSQNEWLVRSRGRLQGALPGTLKYKIADDGSVNGFEMEGFGLAGFGLGLDLGATYQTPVKGLKVSLALVDIGFINWGTNTTARTDGEEFKFDGFKDIPTGNNNTGVPVKDQFQDIKDQAMQLFKFYPENGTSQRTTSLRTTLNVGVEYELVEDKFSFGLLSSTRFSNVFTLSELILSANYRPANWFNMSVSGDVSNVAISWGAVINFCPRFLNFYAGVDFMVTKVSPQYIPIRSGSPTVSVGLNIPIQKARPRKPKVIKTHEVVIPAAVLTPAQVKEQPKEPQTQPQPENIIEVTAIPEPTPAPASPVNPVVEAKEQPAQAEFPTIYFDFNSLAVGTSQQAKLDEIAKKLKENPNIKVELRGWTDTVGTNKVNQEVSLGRAIEVRYQLVKRGIEKNRIKVKSMGVDNNEPDNTKARRVETVK